MDMRVGSQRRLSTEELMLLNCDLGEDSWESFGQQGDPTCQSLRKSTLNIHWKNWCWIFGHLMQRANLLEKALMLWKIEGRRRRGGRGWDDWMASLTQWTWISASCRTQWRTVKPGALQSMGLQRVGCELANKQQQFDGWKTSSCENTPWETRVWSLGWEVPLENGMAIHSSILAWRIPWTEKPGGLQSMGSQRVGHDWLTNTHTHTDFPEVSNVILKLL